MKKLLYVILFLLIGVPNVLGAAPDLTTWTEVDPNSQISLSSNTATYTNYQNAQTAHVYDSGSFGDVRVRVHHKVTSGNVGFRSLYVLHDSLGAYQAQTEQLGFRINNLDMQLIYDAVGSDQGDYTLTTNTDYYTELVVSGTSATMRTYTGSDYATGLVNTQTKTITSRTYPYQSVLMSSTAGSPATTASGIVTIDDITDAYITLNAQTAPIQVGKTTGLGSITAAGDYFGTVTTIEYRWSGGTWTTLDSSPSGGTYSEVITGLSSGQGLEVRFSNNTSVTDSDSLATIGEIFLVQGDSNAQGRVTNLQSYSSTDGYTALMWRENATSWAELADPTDSGTTDGSVWPLLATSIMNNTNRPVAFILTGDGGTKLSTTPFEWKKTGTSYTDSLGELSTSGVNDVRAIVMIVGTNDTPTIASQATFQTDISQMLDDFQTDSGLTDLQMVLCQIPYLSDTYKTGVNYIRPAAQNRWDNDSDILPGPVTYDIDLSVDSDGVHFQTDAEAQVFAERIWHFIDYNFFGNSEGRGPILNRLSKTSNNDEALVSFTVSSPPLQGVTTSGWDFSDDSGALTVTNAVIQNNTEVLLTFNRALSTNPIGSYGSGTDGAGLLFRDSSDTPGLIVTNLGVPPEVFLDEPVSDIDNPALLMMMFQ